MKRRRAGRFRCRSQRSTTPCISSPKPGSCARWRSRAKTYFDTNTSNHYHFFCENSGTLLDIETASIRIEGLPQAPDGMSISRVDVLVRLVDDRKR